jgi:hypothetical protein
MRKYSKHRGFFYFSPDPNFNVEVEAANDQIKILLLNNLKTRFMGGSTRFPLSLLNRISKPGGLRTCVLVVVYVVVVFVVNGRQRIVVMLPFFDVLEVHERHRVVVMFLAEARHLCRCWGRVWLGVGAGLSVGVWFILISERVRHAACKGCGAAGRQQRVWLDLRDCKLQVVAWCSR